MSYPPLVIYKTEHEYRVRFERVYCKGPVQTFDGIQVRFRKNMFDHCFFESVNAPDDTFSIARAQRIDWIQATLQDSSAELRVGWDNKRKQPAKDRRVALVMGDYVVVIRLTGATSAEFVTAFVAGARTLSLIRRNAVWT